LQFSVEVEGGASGKVKDVKDYKSFCIADAKYNRALITFFTCAENLTPNDHARLRNLK